MAYGLWLYKEIINDTGKKTRLEIEKRDYTGASYEITALKGDIVLSVDVDSPTAPIVKSSLSFSIVDTAQVTYSDFFTPDATLYRVKVYDVNGQTQAIRWTGYITPDSFGEPLTYRGEINLTARDNIGYLNDLEFDYNNATTEQYASIKDIVNAAVAKIGGMPVTWYVQKKAATAADGTFDNIENAIVSTYTMLGDNWGNVISELLRGIGCQLRYIDANTFGIYDIENLSDGSVFSPQAVRFLEGSGYREIQPAWKRCVFNQDYQLYTEKEITAPTSYSGEIAVLQNDSKRVNYGATVKMCYNAAGWYLRRGSSLSPELWGLADPYSSTMGDKNAAYIPFFDTDVETRLGMYIQKGVSIISIDRQIKFSFRISPMERATGWSIASGAPQNIEMAFVPYWRLLQDVEKYFYYNIVFVTDDGITYILRNQWILESELTENKMVSVALPETNITRSISDIDVEVSIMTLPGSGTLAVRFYPPSGAFRTTGPQGGSATYHTESCIMVKTIQVTIDNDADTPGGRSRQGSINIAHNVTDNEEYTFGQIPSGSYGIIFYKGGIFADDTAKTPLSHFKRNSSASAVDNLLDLIGCETIQYHKKSYNILSGSVKPSNRTRAISFGNNISYGGKVYLTLSAALSLLENTMQVTQMLEVENYAEEVGIVFSDYTGKNSYSGRSGGGGSSSGGSSIYDHSQLSGRDAADAHPASAITGLSDFMAAMNEMFELEGAGTSASPYVIKAKHDTYTNDSVAAATIYIPHNGTLDRVYDLGVDTDAVTAEVPSEGSGSAVWGGITGTLANQTDLANALAGKQPLINASNKLAYSLISGTPTNVSAFTNDAGYLTGITKAMVENVLTGNISSHTHSYLPLSGGTMTGDIMMSSGKGIKYPEPSADAWTNPRYSGIRVLCTAGHAVEGSPTHYDVCLSVGNYYGFQLASFGGNNGNYWIRGIIDDEQSSWHQLYHSVNCNNTSTPWSASSLTLSGAISGATTGVFSQGVTMATSSGNVGIGTSSPSQKLTVSGGVCMDTLYLPNNGAMSTAYSLQVNTNAITAEIPS